MRTTTHLAIVGPFDLREIALMGFGHRDERSFDGVMRWHFAWTATTSGRSALRRGSRATGWSCGPRPSAIR